MQKVKVKLNNEAGLHARAASIFVQTASKFESDIFLELNEVNVNGKSIIGIMSLGAFSGEEIIIITNGSDEVEAIKILKELIDNNFNGI